MISSKQLEGIDTIGRVLSGLAPLVKKHGETPASLAGRLIGLGGGESLKNTPKWAWFGVGTVTGLAVAYLVIPAVKQRL